MNLASLCVPIGSLACLFISASTAPTQIDAVCIRLIQLRMCGLGWRRVRDSNPRGGSTPPTRLAGGRTRPLCEPSACIGALVGARVAGYGLILSCVCGWIARGLILYL